MKTRTIIAAAVAICLTSCVTGIPEGGYRALPNNRDFNSSYDRVWGVIVAEVSEWSTIRNIDKASGLLTTEEFSIGSTGFTDIDLKNYAYQPPNLLGTWEGTRARLTFLVTPKGDRTNVRVTARFFGFDSVASKSWMEWPTKGVFENEMLDKIGRAVGAR
jgi:hypothetical protein